jgi:hypothetical protein
MELAFYLNWHHYAVFSTLPRDDSRYVIPEAELSPEMWTLAFAMIISNTSFRNLHYLLS